MAPTATAPNRILANWLRSAPAKAGAAKPADIAIDPATIALTNFDVLICLSFLRDRFPSGDPFTHCLGAGTLPVNNLGQMMKVKQLQYVVIK
jgi:hypothetical protein